MNKIIKRLDTAKRISDTGCWEYTGALNNVGYGLVHHGKKLRTVHRVSYEVYIGDIPPGLFVLHTCDVRNCYNPAHLYAGTQTQNMNDMRSRGRDRSGICLNHFGEKHPRAILSNATARAIKHAEGKASDVARDFGVRRAMVYSIRNGRRYRDCDTE